MPSTARLSGAKRRLALLSVPRKPKRRPRAVQVPRSREELEQALRARFGFLRRSAASFDAGEEEEAVRLSLELRTLLHFGTGKPLLHQLGVLKQLHFTDSSTPHIPGNQLPGGGLTIFRMTSGPEGEGRVTAPLSVLPPNRIRPRRPFTQWWKNDLVVSAVDARRYSREFVVLQMSNTDGAHVTAYLDGDYDALKRDNLGWMFQQGSVSAPFRGNVAAASVRQIAWEVQNTLERELPDLLSFGSSM